MKHTTPFERQIYSGWPENQIVHETIAAVNYIISGKLKVNTSSFYPLIRPRDETYEPFERSIYSGWPLNQVVGEATAPIDYVSSEQPQSGS